MKLVKISTKVYVLCMLARKLVLRVELCYVYLCGISDVSRIGITCVQNADAKLKGKYCKQVAWKGTAAA